ncbi:hypothetical protein LRS03_04510 [Rhizobacter sp. J219]|jgi:hypothetical protein|uniref:hypothetical protein n=1 Tax=Rhizobacter sp. J219 TaxID=2898430 RepID=UPI002150FDED|nr:hypothetical protein [Rhizobacter sp. J219]MCR5882161.1 hypothetical protein [Rhizobacter sp. J219]
MRAAPDAPLACTLPTAALSERLAWIRQVTEQHLISHHLSERALRLTYQHDAKAQLERIVAGEQDCCSFLEFNLEGGPATVVLTIRAPEGLERDARWLFDQFLPRAVPSRRCGCAPGACG